MRPHCCQLCFADGWPGPQDRIRDVQTWIWLHGPCPYLVLESSSLSKCQTTQNFANSASMFFSFLQIRPAFHTVTLRDNPEMGSTAENKVTVLLSSFFSDKPMTWNENQRQIYLFLLFRELQIWKNDEHGCRAPAHLLVGDVQTLDSCPGFLPALGQRVITEAYRGPQRIAAQWFVWWLLFWFACFLIGGGVLLGEVEELKARRFLSKMITAKPNQNITQGKSYHHSVSQESSPKAVTIWDNTFACPQQHEGKWRWYWGLLNKWNLVTVVYCTVFDPIQYNLFSIFLCPALF